MNFVIVPQRERADLDVLHALDELHPFAQRVASPELQGLMRQKESSQFVIDGGESAFRLLHQALQAVVARDEADAEPPHRGVGNVDAHGHLHVGEHWV